MRWFTDAVYEGEDDDWDRSVGGYATRLAEIVPRLPADLAALATDPRLDLHDGRFQEVTVDLEAQEVTMVIDGGDLLVGYHRLTLHFRGTTIVPHNLQRLAAAVGAEFRANHWHQRRTVTEIQAQEIDLLPDGRFVLRLRLWPFHEFAIEFAMFSLAEAPLTGRGLERAGRFIIGPR